MNRRNQGGYLMRVNSFLKKLLKTTPLPPKKKSILNIQL